MKIENILIAIIVGVICNIVATYLIINYENYEKNKV